MRPFKRPRRSSGPWRERLIHDLLSNQGVFETILVRKRKIFRLKEHIERILASTKTLQLKTPLDRDALKEAILRKARRSKLEDIYLRVSITPTRLPVIIVRELVPYPEEVYLKGVEIGSTATERVHPEVLNPRIKSQDFLANIMAKIEAIERGLFEGLMHDPQGLLAEGTISNIFIVKNKVLLTPPKTNILEGITRDVVMEIAHRAGVRIHEERLTRYDIHTAEEAFLTYTSVGILPVVKVDGRVIGNGFPGPLTKRLSLLYEEAFQREARPI